MYIHIYVCIYERMYIGQKVEKLLSSWVTNGDLKGFKKKLLIECSINLTYVRTRWSSNTKAFLNTHRFQSAVWALNVLSTARSKYFRFMILSISWKWKNQTLPINIHFGIFYFSYVYRYSYMNVMVVNHIFGKFM